jgi:drug/metabolite transporter (DMT)-like permease
VPVLSTILAIPVLGEVPGSKEIIGVATVSFGVLLASGLFHRRVRISDEVVPPC